MSVSPDSITKTRILIQANSELLYTLSEITKVQVHAMQIIVSVIFGKYYSDDTDKNK